MTKDRKVVLKRPGRGYKRFAHGWGKNIKFVRQKGQWIMVKRDVAKECVYCSDPIVMTPLQTAKLKTSGECEYGCRLWKHECCPCSCGCLRLAGWHLTNDVPRLGICHDWI